MDDTDIVEPPLKKQAFGEMSFSQEEKERIKQALSTKLAKDQVAYRQGPGGREDLSLNIHKKLQNQCLTLNLFV